MYQVKWLGVHRFHQNKTYEAMVLRLLPSLVTVWKFLWTRLCKIRVMLVSIIAGFLLLHLLSFGHLTSESTTSLRSLAWVRRPSTARCKPRSNIAFLKSHKCASSAIQNILFRYGYHHNLTFALPETGNYFGGGIHSFHGDMVRGTPWYRIGNNILTMHMKWDFQQVASIMPNDTVYVTIVREPSELFESLFSYTKMEKSFSKTLDEFVATEDVDMNRFKRYLGYNQMTWDFGMEENQMNNLTAVREMVERADMEFELVMVAERMEESLVLLSHLLCWDLTDVIVLKVNARLENFKKSLSSKTRETLKTRLASDYLLYDYFTKKFDQLVEAYGRERMKKDVALLREATAKVTEQCNFKKVASADMQGSNKPWSEMVSGYSAGMGKKFCEEYSRSELSYINILRGRQKMIMLSKYGPRARLGLDDLPLGAEVLQGTGNMMERLKTLQRMLVHKGPEGSVEGNITVNGDTNSH